MKTKKAALGKREYYLLLIIVLLGIFTTGWYFKGAALYKEVKTLHLEQSNLQEKKEPLLAVLQNRELIEAKWNLLCEQREGLNNIIPPLLELPLALANLETVLENHTVAVHSLRIGETDFKEDHATVELNLNLSGRPHILQAMLRDLEQFPHLLLLEKIRWFNHNNADTTLELQFKMVFSQDVQGAAELYKTPGD